MTKRRLIRWSLIVVILAAFAVWLEPTRVVWGWLRGEAFYQGRPTSWWRSEIVQWKRINHFGSGPHTADWRYERNSTLFESFVSRFAKLPERTWPPLLDGDESGQEVLQALVTDSDTHVSFLADEGLKRLDSDSRGPTIRFNVFGY